ncbi:hypothetical protein ACTJJN_00840 [Pseudomonas sp. 22515]|uniref:hypothetical protein n=1 Tax=unclassified Pseudomonas TaxID=196821 RepID=UPI002BE83C95|nr:hypothetical protein [Pseudomonas sp. A2]MEB3435768.1 hypothetical protein [Pseudomonas sp. A2]
MKFIFPLFLTALITGVITPALALEQKNHIIRHLGGACGTSNTNIYDCATGLTCQNGTCDLASNLTAEQKKCKAYMASLGYDQSNSLNYPAIHGGYCYIDRDTPGMYAAVLASKPGWDEGYESYMIARFKVLAPDATERELDSFKEMAHSKSLDTSLLEALFKAHPREDLKTLKKFVYGKLSIAIPDGSLEEIPFITDYYDYQHAKEGKYKASDAAVICNAHPKSCISNDKLN